MSPVRQSPSPTTQELLERIELIEKFISGSSPGSSPLLLPVWHPLTFLNGFANYNPGFSSGEYALSNGRVFLRGLLKKTPEAWKVNEPIAELPVGFKPISQELLSTVGWDNEAPSGMQQYRIDINSTGLFLVARIGEVGKGTQEKGLVNFLSLDGLSFGVN